MLLRHRYFIMLLSFFMTSAYAGTDLISLFPLDKYDQTLKTWVKPQSIDYNRVLLSPVMQKRHMENFHKRYLAPWDVTCVNNVIKQSSPDDVKTIEKEQLNFFSNKGKSKDMIGYGENFRPYTKSWIAQIKKNMKLEQLDHLKFKETHRAIAVENLYARALPTEDVHFYSHKLAGQGYPFDNLQMSAVWAGTPLYIIAESKDRAWSLVLTPDFIGWVKSTGVARVSDHFIMMWVHQTRRQLAAITQTNTSLIDDEKHFLLTSFVGMVFPATKQGDNLRLTIPVMDKHHKATIKYITVSKKSAAMMPLKATPRHFTDLMNTLINRPYGWGNMNFYNDCSGELKNLFTPFGIWLPRHSAEQVSVGNMTNLSYASPAKRIAYLKEHGRKFLTIVYIKDHIFLYMGKFKNPNAKNGSDMVMTYQNVWGLKPKSSKVPNRRAVIGHATLLPLLLEYPEDKTLKSQAAMRYFKVSFLDEPANYVRKPARLNLRNIMNPKDAI